MPAALVAADPPAKRPVHPVTWERAAHVAAARYAPRLGWDDALQVASIAAWRASLRWDPDGGASEMTWCVRRAVGACHDEVRRVSGWRHGRPPPPVVVSTDRLTGDWWHPTTVDSHPRLELDALAATVAGLGLDDVDRAMACRIAAGATLTEIARADGVTVSGVSRRLRRIRERQGR